MREFI